MALSRTTPGHHLEEEEDGNHPDRTYFWNGGEHGNARVDDSSHYSAVGQAAAGESNSNNNSNGGALAPLTLAVRTTINGNTINNYDEYRHDNEHVSDNRSCSSDDEDLDNLIQQAAMHFGGGGQTKPNRGLKPRSTTRATTAANTMISEPTNSNRTTTADMGMGMGITGTDTAEGITRAPATAGLWDDEDQRMAMIRMHMKTSPGIKRIGGSLRRKSRYQLRRSGTASSTTSDASSKTVLRANGGCNGDVSCGHSHGHVGGNPLSSMHRGSASIRTYEEYGQRQGHGLPRSPASTAQGNCFSFSQPPYAGPHNNFNFSGGEYMMHSTKEEIQSLDSGSGGSVNLNTIMDANTAGLGPDALIRRPGFQHPTPSPNQFLGQAAPYSGAFRNSSSYDDDEDEDEIAAFSELLPHEYQRLSNRNSLPLQRQSQTRGQGQGRGMQMNGLQVLRQRNSIRNSNVSVDSSLMPGNMSGVIPRKRRSHTDIADAAAEVAAYFHNLSDMDEYDDADGDSSSQCMAQSHCSRRSSGTRKTSFTSGTKRGSGASTTGFSRLSIHNNYLEERPRKRRSSSSSVSRIDDSVHRLSAMSANRKSLTSTPFGNSNMTAYNAASAAVAADEAALRLSEAMDTCHSGEDGGGGSAGGGDNHSGVESSGPSNRRRKFERRAGFAVSSIETEAAAALASRTELLKKDRYEKRRVRGGPPAARRSMSYTSGIRASSSIIASNVPEDGESVMDNPEVKTDLINLTRSRMERRVLSLPDQNAVTRLSQTSINEDVDFSGKDSHKSSGLSQNLEASAAAMRRSYTQDQHRTKDFDVIAFLRSQGLYNEHTSNRFGLPSSQPQPSQFEPLQRSEHSHNSNIPIHPPNVPFHNESPFSSVQPPIGQQDISMLAPSLQVAAQVFNTNALAAQSLAQTAQVAIALLNEAQKKSSSEPRSNIGSWDGGTSVSDHQHSTGSFDYESFDGKTSNIEAFEPDTPEEVNIADLIHQAAQLNDTLAVETIIKSCKEATRILESESNTGFVPLHTATKHGSHEVVKMLLESDSNCALIRNVVGNTPLHIAADVGNLAAAIAICSKCPNSAKIQCEEGFLPLHTAVSTGARHPDAPQITTMLLNSFEEATGITTDEGLLAIHYSSMSGFTAGIRTLLSTKFDIISSRTNHDMMLPLDFAIDGLEEENFSDAETDDSSTHNPNINYKSSIELILASTLYDRMITIPHNAGVNYPFLPLHGAAKARPSLDSWKSISLLYNDHALDRDLNGGTATHVLCSHQSDEVERDIGMINTVHRDTFSVRDDDGCLPLHRALFNSNVSFNFFEAIIERQNSAITEEVRSNNGPSALQKLLPVQLAALHKCDLNIIFELMKNTAGIIHK